MKIIGKNSGLEIRDILSNVAKFATNYYEDSSEVTDFYELMPEILQGLQMIAITKDQIQAFDVFDDWEGCNSIQAGQREILENILERSQEAVK